MATVSSMERAPAPDLFDALAIVLPKTVALPEVATMGEFLAWAEQGIPFEVRCSTQDHHRSLIDPHTFALSPDPTDEERTEAAHFLIALANQTPGCSMLGDFVNRSCGGVAPRWISNVPEYRAQVMALRTVARTVQYVDDGLDPRDYGSWIRLGLLPSTPLKLRPIARRYGQNLTKIAPRLLDPLTTSVGNADAWEDQLVEQLTSQLQEEQDYQNARREKRAEERQRAQRRKQTALAVGPSRRWGAERAAQRAAEHLDRWSTR